MGNGMHPFVKIQYYVRLRVAPVIASRAEWGDIIVAHALIHGIGRGRLYLPANGDFVWP